MKMTDLSFWLSWELAQQTILQLNSSDLCLYQTFCPGLRCLSHFQVRKTKSSLWIRIQIFFLEKCCHPYHALPPTHRVKSESTTCFLLVLSPQYLWKQERIITKSFIDCVLRKGSWMTTMKVVVFLDIFGAIGATVLIITFEHWALSLWKVD